MQGTHWHVCTFLSIAKDIPVVVVAVPGSVCIVAITSATSIPAPTLAQTSSSDPSITGVRFSKPIPIPATFEICRMVRIYS